MLHLCPMLLDLLLHSGVADKGVCPYGLLQCLFVVHALSLILYATLHFLLQLCKVLQAPLNRSRRYATLHCLLQYARCCRHHLIGACNETLISQIRSTTLTTRLYNLAQASD